VVSCGQERKLVVSLLDSDGDGEVSFREFFRWWKSHKDKFFGAKKRSSLRVVIFVVGRLRRLCCLVLGLQCFCGERERERQGTLTDLETKR
jgi:hypothetical protein